jgi:hypothetical protein
MDPKKYHVTRGSGSLRGKLIISRPEHEQTLIPGVEVDGNFILSEKFILYQKLKELNLRDPATVEKIRQACSSPQKAEESKRDKKAEQ